MISVELTYEVRNIVSLLYISITRSAVEVTMKDNKPPTTKQLEILDLLYRFRFATNPLLASALNVKLPHKINERLQVLVQREFVGRNYKREYHLNRQPASFYLLPKGIKALRATGDEKYSQMVLHNTYKDKKAKARFITRCLDIFEVYVKVRKEYGGNLQFFTKSELYHYEDFPEPRPDAYFRVQKGQEELQFFKRRIKQYIEYAEGGDWEDATGTSLPAILLICDKDSTRRRLQKHADMQVEDSLEDGLVITLASKEEVTAKLEPKK
jgi:hypothetical protein